MHVHYACTRYIKAQSVSNAAATKKLLRAFAKQCGAEVDFDAMKRAEVEQAEAAWALLRTRYISTACSPHVHILRMHCMTWAVGALVARLSQPDPSPPPCV